MLFGSWISILLACARTTTSFAFQASKQNPTSRKCHLFAGPPSTNEPLSLRQITIPQRYPDKLSPDHQNPYPSPLHTIHIAALLTEDQAAECVKMSKNYAEVTKCWSAKDSDRHVSYSTADFAVEECDELQSYLGKIDFETNVFNVISKLFPVEARDLSFMDLFCACYRGQNEGDSTMDRLAPHRDGTLISFTIVLSPSENYEGGGTEFDALKDGIESNNDDIEDVLRDGVLKVKKAGEGVIHCGKIQHGANIVTSGERIILTGFVEIGECCVRTGVIGEAAKNWGRMDNMQKRYERQNSIVGNIDKAKVASPGWLLSSSKFIKTGGSARSHVQGFAPAFLSVERRGNDKFQREHKLQTEDIFLRDILLPFEDRIRPEELFDLSQFGDITIL